MPSAGHCSSLNFVIVVNNTIGIIGYCCAGNDSPFQNLQKLVFLIMLILFERSVLFEKNYYLIAGL
jgi:hypothetical protein